MPRTILVLAAIAAGAFLAAEALASSAPRSGETRLTEFRLAQRYPPSPRTLSGKPVHTPHDTEDGIIL